MSKRFLTIFLFVSLQSSVLLAQQRTITITITDGCRPVESTHVIVNGILKAITDTSGTSYLLDEDPDSEIKVSHLQFQELTFKSPQKDATIVLCPRLFSIPSLSYHNKDDKEFLKEKLHNGLHVGRSSIPVPVYSLDTLSTLDTSIIFKAKGTVTYMYIFKHRNPIVDIKDFSVNVDCSKSHLKLYSKRIKEEISHHTGNAMAYALFSCLEWDDDNFYVDFLGEDNEDLVFKFYVTPKYKKGEFKAKGLIFMDKTNGIVNRITAILSSLDNDVSFSSYELDSHFSYDESDNSILPSSLYYVSYYVNSERQIVRKKTSHIRFSP